MMTFDFLTNKSVFSYLDNLDILTLVKGQRHSGQKEMESDTRTRFLEFNRRNIAASTKIIFLDIILGDDLFTRFVIYNISCMMAIFNLRMSLTPIIGMATSAHTYSLRSCN